MRKCIALLTREDMRPSYSLAKLARENELSGRNRFRCKTIHDNGWCLGAECNLFPKGGFGGCASAQLTGTSVPVPPPNQVNPTSMRGVAKLGLEDPAVTAVDKEYWGGLLSVRVREVDEYGC